MAEEYGFFNAQLVDSEPDRVYEASDFAGYYASLISTGVFANPATNLQVVPGAEGLSVSLKSGKAFIKGYWYNLTEDVSIPLQSAPTSGARYDAIVVELNLTSRQVIYKLLSGLSTTTMPAASSLTRTTNIYQICVGIIRVAAGATSLTASSIYDTRSDNDYCGWVTGLVDQIDTTGLFAQYNAAFLEWMETVEDLVDDVNAARLQGEIEAIIATLEDGVPSIKEINNGAVIRFWFGTTAQYEALETAGQLLDNVIYIKTDDTSASEIRQTLQSLAENKAPNNHASSSQTYGIGTGTNYGHVKLIDNLTTYYSRSKNGVALDGSLGYIIGQKFTTLEAVASDTGWQTLTVSGTGWSAGTNTPQYRKIGNHVYLRGDIEAGNTTPSAQPISAPYAPTKTSHVIWSTSSSAVFAPVTIGANATVINDDMSKYDGLTVHLDSDYFID